MRAREKRQGKGEREERKWGLEGKEKRKRMREERVREERANARDIAEAEQKG